MGRAEGPVTLTGRPKLDAADAWVLVAERVDGLTYSEGFLCIEVDGLLIEGLVTIDTHVRMLLQVHEVLEPHDGDEDVDDMLAYYGDDEDAPTPADRRAARVLACLVFSEQCE